MDTGELLRRIARPLGGIELAELQGLRGQLELSRGDYEARLTAVEARKNTFFANGSSRSDRRGQQARALQIATLESEANQIAGLLRIAHKQRLLLDRLIWLRENLETISRLGQEAPAAIPADWPALIAASGEGLEEEAQLDELNSDLAKAIPSGGGGPTASSLTDETLAVNIPPPVLGSPLEIGTARSPADPPAPATPTYLVVRVLDGGTIEIAGGKRVRYIGVDAPLMRNALGKTDAGAWEARDANRALVGHKHVHLEADQLDCDADGALWRYVFVGNVLINAELLRQGVVLHVNRYPNNELATDLLAAEQEAKRHRRGLWRPEAGR